MSHTIRLFVSHSSHDAPIAEALLELFQSALNLPASAIRCTSVDGYRLPGGASSNEQLREELLGAETFMGLISPASMRSLFVACELGARWGAGKHLLPILAPGIDASVLEVPLAGVNALRSDRRADLHQMIDELAERLSISPNSAASYERYIERLMQLVPGDDATGSPSVPSVSVSWQSMLIHLQHFDSESSKLQHLSQNIDLVPHELPFEHVVPLLRQFSSESARLRALTIVRRVLADLTEDNLDEVLRLFASESSKAQAFKILR